MLPTGSSNKVMDGSGAVNDLQLHKIIDIYNQHKMVQVVSVVFWLVCPNYEWNDRYSTLGRFMEFVPLEKKLSIYIFLFTQEYKWLLTLIGEVNLKH